MMYVSGDSLINLSKVSLGLNDYGPTLPPENLFLGEIDGITKPFRIAANADGDVTFELWCEFEDQPGQISHMLLNDCNVSENATMSIHAYSVLKHSTDWEGTTDAQLPAEQAKLIFQADSGHGTANTLTWHDDYVQLTDWVGSIWIDKDEVTDHVVGDSRYFASWKVKDEGGSLPGPSYVNRTEGAFTIILRRTSVGPTPPDSDPNSQGLLLQVPYSGSEGWTGKIYGFSVRKEIDGTRVIGRDAIGDQTIATDFGYEVFEHVPIRGVNELYPVNIFHKFDTPGKIQALIIQINDPDATYFDAHNLHLGGGYNIIAPPGITYSPVIPKVNGVKETGFGIPQEGVPVRRFTLPNTFKTLNNATDLHRVLGKATSKPVVVSVYSDEPIGGLRQFWTIMAYLESASLKATKPLMNTGSLVFTEIRVSSNS